MAAKAVAFVSSLKEEVKQMMSDSISMQEIAGPHELLQPLEIAVCNLGGLELSRKRLKAGHMKLGVVRGKGNLLDMSW